MSNFSKGDRVIVTDGTFKGAKGVVTDPGGFFGGDNDVTLDNGERIHVEDGHLHRA